MTRCIFAKHWHSSSIDARCHVLRISTRAESVFATAYSLTHREVYGPIECVGNKNQVAKAGWVGRAKSVVCTVELSVLKNTLTLLKITFSPPPPTAAAATSPAPVSSRQGMFNSDESRILSPGELRTRNDVWRRALQGLRPYKLRGERVDPSLPSKKKKRDLHRRHPVSSLCWTGWINQLKTHNGGGPLSRGPPTLSRNPRTN